MHPLPKCKGQLLGISLVEVTLSLGLISFGVLAIVGNLPIGLSIFREAKERTVESALIQGVTAEYLSYRFSDIPDLATFYFDREGRKVENTDSRKNYRMEVRKESPVYPGMPSTMPQNLNRLLIQVSRVDMDNRTIGSPKLYNTYLSDNGI